MKIAIIVFGIVVVLGGIVGLFFKELPLRGTIGCIVSGIVIIGLGETMRS